MSKQLNILFFKNVLWKSHRRYVLVVDKYRSQRDARFAKFEPGNARGGKVNNRLSGLCTALNANLVIAFLGSFYNFPR
jgi:hypothetical protein